MTKSTVLFTLSQAGDAEFITVLGKNEDGSARLYPADASHPNFDAIKTLCLRANEGEAVNPTEVLDLFDVAETVTRKFQRLTERIAVKGGTITLDGDPVHGTLQDQILDFLDNDEDFGPLVNFYEKLTTNPLGDVQAGLYDWIIGQRERGTLTITPDGDLIGYKATRKQKPAWREVDGDVYVPSRPGEGVVNGIDVPNDRYIEQIAGDVVEMPRSKVLHQPSAACGDGLHIGTYKYASTFLRGDNQAVLLVKFSPRDIVSLPDSNSTWKLRVCRYTVIGTCDEPLDTPVFVTEADAAGTEDAAAEQGIDLDLSVGFQPGDRVVDEDGDVATVVESADEDGDVLVEYDDEDYGTDYVEAEELVKASADESERSARIHGKGGPTSQAAKGRGLNPAQDPATGKFVNGRPGSDRDENSGRFVAKG